MIIKRGRNLKIRKWLIFIIIVNFVVVVYPTTIASGQTNEQSKLAIEVTPRDSLFNVTNMKPGDWTPRTVVVRNNGTMDFEYEMVLQNKGEEKLFNELTLEVSDDQTELFNGKLAEFTALEVRHLVAGNEEELYITVRFPEHLGNEFQGLDTHFALIFTAKGEKGRSDKVKVDGMLGSDDQSPKSGSVLPSTATNMFNLLVIGGVLLGLGGLIFINQRTRDKDNRRNT